MPNAASRIYLGRLNGTPVGDLRLAASDLGLVAVEWADSQPGLDAYLSSLDADVEVNPRQLARFAGQLLEYLRGERRKFSFDLDWTHLTAFQKKVLRAVYAIPYGETQTYAQIAQQIGRPDAPRAVGGANARNPMPLVIPCHRVLGSDGKLHGYGGGKGLATKAWLLKMEGAMLS